MKENNFIKSQNGAIVVEAAFVLPIVIVVVFILVYMALIQIQQGVMYLQAQRMAQKICDITTFPGYEKFYEEAYSSDKSSDNMSLPHAYEPSFNTLDLVYKKHDPYRYLGGVYLNKYNTYEEEINKIVQKSVYLSGGEIKADIDTDFNNISTSVTVLINYSFNLPKFVSIVGIDSSILISTKAVSYANDTVDFIRNTDLAFDLFDYFLKKYHLGDKINTFYKKIREFKLINN